MSRLLVVLLMLLFASPAAAQNEALWLARYCVNEAGFQIEKPFWESTLPNDCSAMERSLVNNYQRERLRTWMMKDYGKRWWRRDRVGPRRYIPFLRPGRTPEPRGWMRASWPRYRPRFNRLYRFTQIVVSGRYRASCEPHHWGAPSLRRRSRRKGWIRLDCGETVNDYWQVPGRD